MADIVKEASWPSQRSVRKVETCPRDGCRNTGAASMRTLIFIASLAVGPPAIVIAFGARRSARAVRNLYPEPIRGTGTQPSQPPGGAAGRPTAVVLLDRAGTEISDFLVPYELLVASGAFNVLAVAADASPACLTGGLDVVPHASFGSLGGDADVDLVVVPHLPDPDPRTIAWVRDRAGRGATVLTICTGAGVAATAGILDGRPATAHWADLRRFERRFPQVRWEGGVRYVDAGDVVASAGITSGIDATLHVIRRFAGIEAVQRAAETIGYRDLSFLDDATTPQHRVRVADAILPLTAAFGRREDLAVVLSDGVDETSLAAVMDTHAATFTARIRTFASGKRAVRSRHGLILVPRHDLAHLRADHVVVPRVAGGTSTPADGTPYGDFHAAIDDLAVRRGTAIARFAAKRLELDGHARSAPAPGEPRPGT